VSYDFINPDDMYGTAETVLEAVWKVEQKPHDPAALRCLAASPPKTVQGLLERGYLKKSGTWAIPTLTEKGRERLCAYRTCWDCHEEILVEPHICPARPRRPGSPYREPDETLQDVWHDIGR
jgi:hypothetical protein